MSERMIIIIEMLKFTEEDVKNIYLKKILKNLKKPLQQSINFTVWSQRTNGEIICPA